MRSARPLVALLVITALLAGCSKGHRKSDPETGKSSSSPASSGSAMPHATGPKASASPAASPTPPVGLVVDRWLDTSAAIPSRMDVSSRAHAVTMPSATASFYDVLAMGAGGRLFTERGVVRDEKELIGTAHVGWLTRSGFDPFDYADSHWSSQVIGGSVDGRRATWAETTSTDLFNSNWRIFAAVGTSGRTLVADSRSVYGKAMLRPAFGQTMPVLLGTKVYWAAVPPGGEWKDTRVLVDDLDGSSARPTVLKGAVLPASNGRRLFLVRQRLPEPSTGEVHIVSRTEDGKEADVERFRLTAGSKVTALAASRTHLAWVISEPDLSSKLFVEDLATHSVTGIVMHHRGISTMTLGAGRNLVAWGNGSDNPPSDAGEYVFRPRTGALVRLGRNEGYSVALAYERWIAWTPQSRQRGPEITTYLVSH